MRLHQKRKTDFRRVCRSASSITSSSGPSEAPRLMDEDTVPTIPRRDGDPRIARACERSAPQKFRSRTIIVATLLYDHEEYRKADLAKDVSAALAKRNGI